MVALNPTQKMHVDRVRTVRASLRDAKAYSEARAKTLVSEELAGHQAALDHEVRLAFDAGVPKLQIRRDGLGTTDSKTLEDILKRTEGAAAALAGKLEADPLHERYTLDGDVLTITLAGQELDAAHEAVSHYASTPTADFEVAKRQDGSRYITNITPLAEAPTWDEHAVVVWARNPANEREALNWVATHRALVAA